MADSWIQLSKMIKSGLKICEFNVEANPIIGREFPFA